MEPRKYEDTLVWGRKNDRQLQISKKIRAKMRGSTDESYKLGSRRQHDSDLIQSYFVLYNCAWLVYIHQTFWRSADNT